MQKYFVVSILVSVRHRWHTDTWKLQNPLILCGIKSTIFVFFKYLYSEDYIPASSQSRKKIRDCLEKVKVVQYRLGLMYKMKINPLGEMAEPIWGSRGVKTQTVEGETGFVCAWRFPGEPQNQRRPENIQKKKYAWKVSALIQWWCLKMMVKIEQYFKMAYLCKYE